MSANNSIKICRTIHGFSAEDSFGNYGGGQSVAEAVGVLVLRSPQQFGVSLIAYDTDSATTQYLLSIGRERIIHDGKCVGS